MERSNVGQWTTVTYRRKSKFGLANDCVGNFKAAERKVPIFISNISVSTSEKDITDYILAKKKISVKLERIQSKKHKLNHKSFKFFVPESMDEIFLDGNLWPKANL